MGKRFVCALLAAGLLFCGGCTQKDKQMTAADAQQKMSDSFQTTAKVTYKELETVMTIYKKPMNCAEVAFVSPESLKDIKLVFYPDRVAVRYKELAFDFVPDSIPGKAASKLVLDAINAALKDDGVSVSQTDGCVTISGQLESGSFALVIDAKSGNILKLSIPDSQLELEVLNFKILA